MEGPKKSSLKQLESDRLKLAKIVRVKLKDGLALTNREEQFYREQQQENWRDDNPYRH